MNFSSLVALLYLGIVPLLLSAQSFSQAKYHPKYHLNVWSADDGLPQNVIRGIAQTPDGYLWIATLDGLARFDGLHFTVFNRSNTPISSPIDSLGCMLPRVETSGCPLKGKV
jgi:ligand-binding sensor domain-containing protein